MSAFDYLYQLDNKFSAESGALLSNNRIALRTLYFRVAEYNLLIPLDTSTEIISDLDYAPIPLSKSWLLGIASHRGELLTLIDLKSFLFETEPLKKNHGRRVIVNKTATVFLGLIVDQVIGLMNIPSDQLDEHYPPQWNNAVLNILAATYKEDNTCFGVCDLNKMINHKHFAQTQNLCN